MPSPNALRIITVISFFALFIAGLKRPVWAAVAYMVLVYCKISSYYPIFFVFRVELVSAWLIVLLLVIKGNFKRVYPFSNLVNLYLLALASCVFISFSIAWQHQYSWENAVYHFIKAILLYVMILVSIRDEKDLKYFVWSFLIMFAYLAYEPCYGFITETGGSRHTYGTNYVASIGILAGHVALANNMNQIIPLAFFLIPSAKRLYSRISAAILLLIFFTALVASGSRGGIVGFSVFCVVLVLMSKNRIRNGIVMLCVLGILFFGSQRLSSTAKRIDESSIKGRLTAMTHAVGILCKGNILGVGPGCFLFARSKYFHYRMEPHNIYAEMLGDLGIPGTVAWILFMRQIFLNLSVARRKRANNSRQKPFRHWLALGVLCSLIVRLVISLSSMGLYYFYWYVMAAISIVISEMGTNQQPVEKSVAAQ